MHQIKHIQTKFEKKSRVRAVQVTVNSAKYDIRLIIYSISQWTCHDMIEDMAIWYCWEGLVFILRNTYDNNIMSISINRLIRSPGLEQLLMIQILLFMIFVYIQNNYSDGWGIVDICCCLYLAMNTIIWCLKYIQCVVYVYMIDVMKEDCWFNRYWRVRMPFNFAKWSKLENYYLSTSEKVSNSWTKLRVSW